MSERKDSTEELEKLIKNIAEKVAFKLMLSLLAGFMLGAFLFRYAR